MHERPNTRSPPPDARTGEIQVNTLLASASCSDPLLAEQGRGVCPCRRGTSSLVITIRWVTRSLLRSSPCFAIPSGGPCWCGRRPAPVGSRSRHSRLMYSKSGRTKLAPRLPLGRCLPTGRGPGDEARAAGGPAHPAVPSGASPWRRPGRTPSPSSGPHSPPRCRSGACPSRLAPVSLPPCPPHQALKARSVLLGPGAAQVAATSFRPFEKTGSRRWRGQRQDVTASSGPDRREPSSLTTFLIRFSNVLS